MDRNENVLELHLRRLVNACEKVFDSIDRGDTELVSADQLEFRFTWNLRRTYEDAKRAIHPVPVGE